MMICMDPVEVNMEFHLRLIVPQNIEENKRIDFDVKYVWCENDIVKPNFIASGFTLQNIDKNEVEFIRLVIGNYGLPSTPFRV